MTDRHFPTSRHRVERLAEHGFLSSVREVLAACRRLVRSGTWLTRTQRLAWKCGQLDLYQSHRIILYMRGKNWQGLRPAGHAAPQRLYASNKCEARRNATRPGRKRLIDTHTRAP